MSIKAMVEPAMLDVWAADKRLVGIRNYALPRMMVYTGLRRAEVVPLR